MAALVRGGLVAFPTETVYGLGADATNVVAVRRLFAVKGRPPDHPVIVHVASADALDGWAVRVPDAAGVLAERFWPGPLTLVLERQPWVIDQVTGGRPTVGLRVPAQPLALEMLERFERAVGAAAAGVAAPSANRFGRVSPTTAAHVAADLDGDVDLIVDGGPCAVGVESTILDLTVAVPTILRPGGVTAEEIEGVLARPVEQVAVGPSRAPGMLASHYAPRCEVCLVDSGAAAELRAAERRAAGRTVRVIGAPAAPELYGLLRAADADGIDELVVIRPAAVGLGVAVRDRLAKAAAPRPRA